MNKAILHGRIGSDPELRMTSGGQPVVRFRLATSERFRRNGGELEERTEWHTIVIWGDRGQKVHQYLRKGLGLLITGKIHYTEWEDRDGQKRYGSEIIVDELEFGARPKGEQQRPPGSTRTEGGPAAGDVAEDDDIPF